MFAGGFRVPAGIGLGVDVAHARDRSIGRAASVRSLAGFRGDAFVVLAETHLVAHDLQGVGYFDAD